MYLTHRTAFELLQRSIDGLLSTAERAELERHLADCAECQEYAALYHQLEKQALAHHPSVMPSRKDIQQTIRVTQAHHRRSRMLKRLFSPVRMAAGAAAVIAFVLAVIWIFNALPQQSESGESDTAKIVKETVTPKPAEEEPTKAPEPTETPEPTKAPEPTEAPMEEEEFRIGMVTDMGGLTDAWFNQATWEGFGRAYNEIEGLAVMLLESQAEADYEDNISEFAEQGYDIVVTVGFTMGDATAKMAAVYPDLKFAIVDWGYDPPISNVQGIEFNSNEVAFMAGYLAAGMAVELDPNDPQIGWVSGVQHPKTEIYVVAYEAGMAYYNQQHGTSVSSSGTYTGDFVAFDKGKAVGNSLLDEGVDIIFGVGGLTGNGALFAVRERADAGEAVAGIGVDGDLYRPVPQVRAILLTSVMKNVDNAVFSVIEDAVAGNFGGGGNYVGTLANDGVGLAPYHDWEDRVPAELKAEVEALRPLIISGAVSTGWPVSTE